MDQLLKMVLALKCFLQIHNLIRGDEDEVEVIVRFKAKRTMHRALACVMADRKFHSQEYIRKPSPPSLVDRLYLYGLQVKFETSEVEWTEEDQRDEQNALTTLRRLDHKRTLGSA